MEDDRDDLDAVIYASTVEMYVSRDEVQEGSEKSGARYGAERLGGERGTNTRRTERTSRWTSGGKMQTRRRRKRRRGERIIIFMPVQQS